METREQKIVTNPAQPQCHHTENRDKARTLKTWKGQDLAEAGMSVGGEESEAAAGGVVRKHCPSCCRYGAWERTQGPWVHRAGTATGTATTL